MLDVSERYRPALEKFEPRATLDPVSSYCERGDDDE